METWLVTRPATFRFYLFCIREYVISSFPSYMCFMHDIQNILDTFFIYVPYYPMFLPQCFLKCDLNPKFYILSQPLISSPTSLTSYRLLYRTKPWVFESHTDLVSSILLSSDLCSISNNSKVIGYISHIWNRISCVLWWFIKILLCHYKILNVKHFQLDLYHSSHLTLLWSDHRPSVNVDGPLSSRFRLNSIINTLPLFPVFHNSVNLDVYNSFTPLPKSRTLYPTYL